ncbi:leucyl aminopeptidase [Rhodoblastus sphagnicola]|uniref:Leucyl aminopeptidase n=1 Tax=Rhodoblastus sphagnicola TaxID=333368 RepID=A0A2S6N5I8_9HYPH|nr:leucyl aminopeptidase family protein [Rhodoblastus sphagnicola]MBB4197271.1 leucyl aminopeptidase [Rhodoblastus sphagnicola]PPQ29876.1 leucyl aminopeptidase [Rhodoblastus sphagnicola]
MFELPEVKFADPSETATPVWIAPAAAIKAALAGETQAHVFPPEALALARASGFEPRAGRHLSFVQESGASAVLFCLDADPGADPFQLGALAGLPEGVYRLVESPENPTLASLAFLLGAYRFTRYKPGKPGPRLVAPQGIARDEVETIASAVALARDLVNTPANDLGPDELEFFARAVAQKFGAEVRVIRGEALERECPLIHAVGKGSPRAPRLVELRWKPEREKKLALVGKGVCFDSGGLDIKPESAMGLMKKDMGGAAAALAASAMIMAGNLDLSLRLLLPIVENSVSGEAFRPGDVYRSRKGLTVEIGNTDAEGRLILADALALADEEKPDLLIDFATLTGAARVALGPDLPPFYTEDEGLAESIARHGLACNDPVWRLPLWKAYEPKLDSKIADLTNAPAGGMAGSIMAALFLKRFVSPGRCWAHFDIYAWVPLARPGRPDGGEAQAARLIHALAREKFGVAKIS